MKTSVASERHQGANSSRQKVQETIPCTTEKEWRQGPGRTPNGEYKVMALKVLYGPAR